MQDRKWKSVYKIWGTVMEKDIENAHEQFEKWLSSKSYMQNIRHKTEYVGEFIDGDGMVCYIFKYKKMPSGSWLLGIVSDSQAYSISRNYDPATQIEYAELTLHYLKHHLKVLAVQDAMMEKYKDYQCGTYKSMSLQEKMDFLDGVQKEFIPIFDEDGMDMDTLSDFWSIQTEFEENPQMFIMENMAALMHMLDDECFELSMMHQLASIICRIAVHYGREGVCFLLEHFDEVPREGIWHGHFRVMQFLMRDTYYSLLKEAVVQCAPIGREQLLAILLDFFDDEYADDREKIEELKNLCTAIYPKQSKNDG